MRTNLYRAATVLLAVLATLATLAVAPASAAPAAGPPVSAPVGLEPDGTAAQRFVASPVSFEARPADSDADATVRVFVQQLAGGRWRTVDDGAAPTRGVVVADGALRWRARTENADGAGPWTPWVRLVVDSRVPATPVVSIPDAPVVIGRPVPITLSSPDHLAAQYFLGRDNLPPVQVRGFDPCAAGSSFICPPSLGGTVTVPYAFLTGYTRLFAFAYSRAHQVSPATSEADIGAAPDTAAIPAAARWSVPADTGPASRVPEVHGGTALGVGPTTAVGVQHYPLPTTGGDRHTDATADTVDVPSIDTTVSTNVRTVGPVVDTGATFSVGVIVTPVANPPVDVTLLDQPGADGPAFTLTLTRDRSVRFCASTTDATTTCTSVSVPSGTPTFGVVASYDAVGRQISVSSDLTAVQPWHLPGSAPLRAASGGLRFGAAAVPGTQRYRGLVGSPFVARGWVTGADLDTFLTPAA